MSKQNFKSRAVNNARLSHQTATRLKLPLLSPFGRLFVSARLAPIVKIRSPWNVSLELQLHYVATFQASCGDKHLSKIIRSTIKMISGMKKRTAYEKLRPGQPWDTKRLSMRLSGNVGEDRDSVWHNCGQDLVVFSSAMGAFTVTNTGFLLIPKAAIYSILNTSILIFPATIFKYDIIFPNIKVCWIEKQQWRFWRHCNLFFSARLHAQTRSKRF